METLEVSSPSGSLAAAGPRLRERPLGRCHTLDSGEHAPERPERTHTPNTTEHTPKESDQLFRDTDDDTNESHSADVTDCCAETSPPPPSLTPTNRSASLESDKSSDSRSPLNGELEESSDHQTPPHTEDTSTQSDSGDGDSYLSRLADLNIPIHTDEGDQRDADQPPDTSTAELNQAD